MTTDTERVQPRDTRAARALFVGALGPVVVVAGLCVAASALVEGRSGLWGALAGSGLVVGFFATSHLVLPALPTAAFTRALVAALAFYAIKVTGLALAFVLFASLGWLGDPLHAGALGLTMVACTLTWTAMAAVTATRLPIPVYDERGS